ncbi:hypothetical protein LOAG_18830 [Loa loa]|uniref:Zinc finger protein n=1 Tax=Loa loa TaxID=7209 RepID=A0A1S0UEC1_LOALO|nr:hypothetical protein LOAG_18830 [Loa loa]EJD73766.1 hypothetical protein LOAG_18830 [Loa loa]
MSILGPAEGNPQLGHTSADTRNLHIAGQSSVGQQDRSSDEYPLRKLNGFDDCDGSIFDDLDIPDDVVVDVEDINIGDDNILADARNDHIAGQSSVDQQDHSSDDYFSKNFNILDCININDINILDDSDVEILDDYDFTTLDRDMDNDRKSPGEDS